MAEHVGGIKKGILNVFKEVSLSSRATLGRTVALSDKTNLILSLNKVLLWRAPCKYIMLDLFLKPCKGGWTQLLNWFHKTSVSPRMWGSMCWTNNITVLSVTPPQVLLPTENVSFFYDLMAGVNFFDYFSLWQWFSLEIQNESCFAFF